MRENFDLLEGKVVKSERNSKNNEDDTEVKWEKLSESIPSYFILLLLGVLMTLGLCTVLIDDALPSAVSINDAGVSHFSEERAWTYLREVVGTGPRVAGTAYHLKKTIDLKRLVDDIAGNATRKVHTDWQFVSGDYWLKARAPFVNAYHNLSNIVVVLEGDSGFNTDNTTNSSILFNCHYDSVPTSPGASDNALFCAVMLETLFVVSKSEKPLKHNIVFLFNGAEENPVQGSAGFLKHPWSKGVTALVNLDSAGTNCKSLLFQVTDSRVVQSYIKAVPRPSAQAFGEVLFASGIVPSDTDFRIFRDLAQIYGVDIAFTKWGHVYHTRYDSLATIKEGVIQHSGNMILALAREMGDSDMYYTKAPMSKAVFWDYMNLFMFSYGDTAAYIVDVICLFIGIASVAYYLFVIGFRRLTYRELALSVLSRLLNTAVGAGCLWLVAALMVATTIQLRYLSNGWLVVPIFWLPYLIGAVTTSQLFDAWRSHKSGLNRVRRTLQAMTATRIILILITTVLLCVPNSATARYVITLPLLLMSATSFVSLTLVSRWSVKEVTHLGPSSAATGLLPVLFKMDNWQNVDTARYKGLEAYQHIVLEVVLAVPALLLYFVFAVKINTLMLPIMGRTPSLTPDYIVAGLNMFIVVLCTIPLSGVELLFSRVRLWISALVVLIVALSVALAPLSPYKDSQSSPVLQRHYWFHTEVTSYDMAGNISDARSGVWMAHVEVNTPEEALRHAIAGGFNVTRLNFDADCNNYTYCNLPVYYPRVMHYINHSVLIDFEPPTKSVPDATLVVLEKKLDIRSNKTTLRFNITGPTHMSLVIWPRNNNTLTSWSFETDVSVTAQHGGRPVYYVFYTRGTYTDTVAPQLVELTFNVPNPDNSPITDLSFVSHRLQHPEQFTRQYKKLITSMPAYCNIATFLSNRQNYVF